MRIDLAKFHNIGIGYPGLPQLLELDAPLEFPGGHLSIIEPMTYFTEIDAELAKTRIAVPGPARVSAAVMFCNNMKRPLAVCLTFSDAPVASVSVAGLLSVDTGQFLIGDTDLLTYEWARGADDHAASKTMPLAKAIDLRLLGYSPISDEIRASEWSIFSRHGIAAGTTGAGDGVYQIVRHDDTSGSLVRLVIEFFTDDLDFQSGEIDAVFDFGAQPILADA